MEHTLLYQITETSRYMMAFVIVTRENNVIVIDGGRPKDMPLVKQYIGGRHISAWILSHAHSDHISGFIREIERNGGADFDLETLYYNFPPYQSEPPAGTPNPDYFMEEMNEMLPAFAAIEPQLAGKTHIVRQGESIQIDECRIDFLFTKGEIKAIDARIPNVVVSDHRPYVATVEL